MVVEDPRVLAAHRTVRLSDEAFADAQGRFINVCVDVVPINPRNKSLILAKRKIKPAQDCWWPTGGSRPAGKSLHEGVSDNLLREVGMPRQRSQKLLRQRKIKYAGFFEAVWKNRQQEPQDSIQHVLADVFYWKPTELELAEYKKGLTPDEFHVEEGIREFTKEELEALALKDETEKPGTESPYRFLLQYWNGIFYKKPLADRLFDAFFPPR